jgi:hypothetical protein
LAKCACSTCASSSPPIATPSPASTFPNSASLMLPDPSVSAAANASSTAFCCSACRSPAAIIFSRSSTRSVSDSYCISVYRSALRLLPTSDGAAANVVSDRCSSSLYLVKPDTNSSAEMTPSESLSICRNSVSISASPSPRSDSRDANSIGSRVCA